MDDVNTVFIGSSVLRFLIDPTLLLLMLGWIVLAITLTLRNGPMGCSSDTGAGFAALALRRQPGPNRQRR